MIKSTATKVRIECRKKAKEHFDRSTSEGRYAFKEYLRGLLVDTDPQTKYNS